MSGKRVEIVECEMEGRRKFAIVDASELGDAFDLVLVDEEGDYMAYSTKDFCLAVCERRGFRVVNKDAL